MSDWLSGVQSTVESNATQTKTIFTCKLKGLERLEKKKPSKVHSNFSFTIFIINNEPFILINYQTFLLGQKYYPHHSY